MDLSKYIEELKEYGIVVSDNSRLGMGFHIGEQPFQYAKLIYERDRFGIGTTGTRIFDGEVAELYSDELTTLNKIVKKFNSYLKK